MKKYYSEVVTNCAKFYVDYVSHCARFYSRHSKPEFFKTEANRKDWQAVDTALKAFTDEEKDILLTIYREGDTIPDNVYQLAKKKKVNQNSLWKVIDRFEKEVAKRRGLI